MSLDARQMLILSQLQTKVTLAQLKDNPSAADHGGAAQGHGGTAATAASQLTADWATATAKAEQLPPPPT
jgi:hypothetical protein